MEIEVYDTYATSEKGIKIHFDVMLAIGGADMSKDKRIYDVISVKEG